MQAGGSRSRPTALPWRLDMQIDKAKIKGFAKRAATPPPAAVMLAKKRAATKPEPKAVQPSGNLGDGSDDDNLPIYELVDRAAEAAEKGEDIELEDAMAGATSIGPDDPPPGFDPAKWKEAAEAVGLGPDGLAQDQFEEPAIVTAYLYKLIGGPMPGEDVPPAPATPETAGEDMARPGAAAKALARSRAGVPPAGPKKGAIGNPALAKSPQHGKPGMTVSEPTGAGAGSPDAEDQKHVEIGAKEAAEAPDPELVEKLKDYDPERDGNPPAWIEDEATWERAKKAVEPKWSEYDEPYAVVAHVYRSMGGTVK